MRPKGARLYTGTMPDPETLAQVVESTGPLMTRYLDGFTEQARVASAPGLPNHVVWTLGHLALYLRRAADRLAGREIGPLPASDFVTGDGRAGDAQRFDSESICFGSQPSPDASVYPSLARGVEVFAGANAAFAATVRSVTAEHLAEETTWGAKGRVLTNAQLVHHMAFHNATHIGQIMDLRRALGMTRTV